MRPLRVNGAKGADRLVFVAAVAMVVPAWVAALREGFGRHIPVGDTAIMALRAPDVLSRHPPLIGMPASGASNAAHVVHFPGALQLYWLAIPVRVLGPTWGTVVAMGLLNTIWILLAAWLIRRNLDRATALCAYVFLSVFLWSIGSGMLIDSWPLLMVVVPFVLVVIAAWATACGDLRALVVLAVVTNYVWLDHLVLAMLAPLVALTGCVGLALWYRRARRTEGMEEETEEAAAGVRRDLRRHVGVAAAVTFVLWIPSLLQQAFGSTGNLGLLASRSGGGQPAIGSLSASVHVMASLVGDPPFWFRGTLRDPTFYRAHASGFAVGSVTWLDLMVGLIVVGCFVGLGVDATRRKDRVGLWLLVVAAVSLLGGVLTVYLAPQTTAVVPEYLFSLWVVAMFTWLAVGINILRTFGALTTQRLAVPAFSLVVLFSALNLPVSHTGYTAHPADTAVAGPMTRSIVRQLSGSGPVGITLAHPLADNADTLSALLVELRRAHIAFCYPVPNTSLYEFIPDCDGSEKSVLVITESQVNTPPAGEVLFRSAVGGSVDKARLATLDAHVEAWLGHQKHLSLTIAAQRPFLGSMVPGMLRSQVAGFAAQNGSLTSLAENPAFWRTIILWYQRSDNRNAPLFLGQSVGNRDLYDWASMRQRHGATLWVSRHPSSGGS